MEKATLRAIGGGWKSGWKELMGFELNGEFNKDFLLYPDFWKSLGKAEGWTRRGIDKSTDEKIRNGMFTMHEGNTQEEWKFQMHNFIDHIAEGKDIDSFFDNLLTNK